MRSVVLAVLFSCAALGRTGAAEPAPAPPATPYVPKTAKERLSDKTSDEQRVNDCKVSPERRAHARPTTCPWDAGS